MSNSPFKEYSLVFKYILTIIYTFIIFYRGLQRIVTKHILVLLL